MQITEPYESAIAPLGNPKCRSALVERPPDMTAVYAFRPMLTTDLPTVKRWLETPHVSEWWHDPAEQFELVSGDLDHPDMAQFIVAVDGREFAYLQCYNL